MYCLFDDSIMQNIEEEGTRRQAAYGGVAGKELLINGIPLPGLGAGLQEMAKKDTHYLKIAETLDEIAGWIGCKTEILVETVREYNEGCGHGRDHIFGKDRIYLLAHSGGTPIALLAVARAPQLFHAYIAMAQISNPIESEKMAYRYMLEEYGTRGDKKTVKELLAYDVLHTDASAVKFFKSALRDRAMHELGVGTMHRMKSVFWGVFIPVWTCRAYTFREKIAIWKAKISFLPKTGILDELCANDFAKRVPSLEIPVYFMSGKHDLTVNVDLAKAYFIRLKAPLKGFYTFEKSAHSPLFEEPDRFREIVRQDVLHGRNDLADRKI